MSMYTLLVWQKNQGPCIFSIILKIMPKDQKDPAQVKALPLSLHRN